MTSLKMTSPAAARQPLICCLLLGQLLLLLIIAGMTRGASARVLYTNYTMMEVGPLVDTGQVEKVKSLADWRTRKVFLLDSVSLNNTATLIISPDRLRHVETQILTQGIQRNILSTNLQKQLEQNRRQNERAKKKSRRQREKTHSPDLPSSYRLDETIECFDHKSYLSYDEQVDWLKQKSPTSDRTILMPLGRKTYEGRLIYALHINYDERDKPMIWIDANMRGCDWITSASVIWLIDQILDGNSGDGKYLRENFRFLIVVNANPDGYEYSRTTDRLWSKNRSYHPPPPTTHPEREHKDSQHQQHLTRQHAGQRVAQQVQREVAQPLQNEGQSDDECLGVDLTRNFDCNFSGPESSADRCHDNYYGPYVFSEVETSQIKDLVLGFKNDIKLFFSMHAYGQKILLPWGYSHIYEPADIAELKRVALVSAHMMWQLNQKVYEVGRPSDFSGLISGASYDWGKKYLNVPYPFMIKLRPATAGEGGVDLPPSHIIDTGKEVLVGIAAAAQNALLHWAQPLVNDTM